ncbi:predicted protein [Nematostella vectensis]|uniref:Mab-21-like HhH/H2TH-like domain-containing protein n=1 Tax=Nematostella vectensis TaxID=45351 RepID=A7RFY3_NEMVE|nr:uncharacterized protein LOC5522097 [Nematostella vectensis]EDO49681.1 predicted protein [Nematostella vectensis]|eukprot:XP_001641744.1 predicted protein [Nematostella vectensis]
MSVNTYTFDEVSELWMEPFSLLISDMFPVEFIYTDWYWWQGNHEANREDPDCLMSTDPRDLDTGSLTEGFCIPRFFLAKSDKDPFGEDPNEKVYWQPDRDLMKEVISQTTPIFTVEHLQEDPRYAKLKLTEGWKAENPRYKGSTYLHHAYLLPMTSMGKDFDRVEHVFGFEGEIHGPVRKVKGSGFGGVQETDTTSVFKYPDVWPEPGMDWLVRPRPGGWPLPELIQEIVELGCHLAPVGRGKRTGKTLTIFQYKKNPELAGTSRESKEGPDNHQVMDEFEWRMSFSLAENRLAQSLTPVQRHTLVLLKIIKKVYFPEVISSYFLKNLLFWECENNGESFWKGTTSGKCLLRMLDRLQDCFEKGNLPHYIIPESNLLAGENPRILTEAVKVIFDIRKTILRKTASVIIRLHTTFYFNHIFLKKLDLEPIFSSIEDPLKTVEGVRAALISIHNIFIPRYVEAIQRTANIDDEGDEGMIIDKRIITLIYISLLARNLAKLWLLERHQYKTEFTAFMRDTIGGDHCTEELVSMASVFLELAEDDKDSSVNKTQAMWEIKRLQKRINVKNVEEARQGFAALLEIIRRPDMENVTDKMKGDVANLDDEDEIAKVFNKTMAAILEEKAADPENAAQFGLLGETVRVNCDVLEKDQEELRASVQPPRWFPD